MLEWNNIVDILEKSNTEPSIQHGRSIYMGCSRVYQGMLNGLNFKDGLTMRPMIFGYRSSCHTEVPGGSRTESRMRWIQLFVARSSTNSTVDSRDCWIWVKSGVMAGINWEYDGVIERFVWVLGRFIRSIRLFLCHRSGSFLEKNVTWLKTYAWNRFLFCEQRPSGRGSGFEEDFVKLMFDRLINSVWTLTLYLVETPW